MTTIIYDHKNKLIALDSRLTQGDYICDDQVEKFLINDDCAWFFAGNAGEQKLFTETFKHLARAPENLQCTALFVANKEVFMRNVDNNGIFRECQLKFTDGIGSGCEHAINAMDLGLNAIESIEYAIKKDCKSGGLIRLFSVVDHKFIEK